MLSLQECVFHRKLLSIIMSCVSFKKKGSLEIIILTWITLRTKKCLLISRPATKLLSQSERDDTPLVVVSTNSNKRTVGVWYITKPKSNSFSFVLLFSSFHFLGCFLEESSNLPTSCHKFCWGWLVAQSGISSYGVLASWVQTVFWTQHQTCSGKPWGNDDYTYKIW